MARTILNFGESGTFKTTQGGVFADYQVKRWNRVMKRDDCFVRMITSDSTVNPVADQITSGVIAQPWCIKGFPKPLAAIYAASMGYWPSVIDKYGEADPDSLKQTAVEDWDRIAGYFVEGLTQNADLLMDWLAESRIDTGEPLNSLYSEVLSDIRFDYAEGSRGSFKFVQNKSRKYVKNFSALPVDRVMITAHEGKGEDTTKKLVFGPAIAGKALNDKVCGWFENTFHHESYTATVERMVGKKKITLQQSKVRAYFTRHADTEVPTVFWPAKLGVSPRIAVKVLEAFPHGYIPLEIDEQGECVSGIHDFLRIVDEAEDENKKKGEK